MNSNFRGFLFIAGSVLSCLVGCNTVSTADTSTNIAGDYMYESPVDTISLELKQVKDSVYGELEYAFSGKDNNNGHINGLLKDSLITAEYNFVSEGITSVREIVFKLTDEGLIEGYGGVEEKTDGKMIFSDKSSLSFDHGMVLKKKEY